MVNNVVQISKDLEGQIVDDIMLSYYTVIYCSEGMENDWMATGILEPVAEEALKKFSTFSSGAFHLVRIGVKMTKKE